MGGNMAMDSLKFVFVLSLLWIPTLCSKAGGGDYCNDCLTGAWSRIFPTTEENNATTIRYDENLEARDRFPLSTETTSTSILPLNHTDLLSVCGNESKSYSNKVYIKYKPDKKDFSHCVCTITGADSVTVHDFHAANPAVGCPSRLSVNNDTFNCSGNNRFWLKDLKFIEIPVTVKATTVTLHISSTTNKPMLQLEFKGKSGGKVTCVGRPLERMPAAPSTAEETTAAVTSVSLTKTNITTYTTVTFENSTETIFSTSQESSDYGRRRIHNTSSISENRRSNIALASDITTGVGIFTVMVLAVLIVFLGKRFFAKHRTPRTLHTNDVVKFNSSPTAENNRDELDQSSVVNRAAQDITPTSDGGKITKIKNVLEPQYFILEKQDADTHSENALEPCYFILEKQDAEMDLKNDTVESHYFVLEKQGAETHLENAIEPCYFILEKQDAEIDLKNDSVEPHYFILEKQDAETRLESALKPHYFILKKQDEETRLKIASKPHYFMLEKRDAETHLKNALGHHYFILEKQNTGGYLNAKSKTSEDDELVTSIEAKAKDTATCISFEIEDDCVDHTDRARSSPCNVQGHKIVNAYSHFDDVSANNAASAVDTYSHLNIVGKYVRKLHDLNNSYDHVELQETVV